MESTVKNRLHSGLRVVAVGGGTGLSTLLRGLKRRLQYPAPRTGRDGQGEISSLTAIVAVTDDGGSSGRLRRDLGIPAPGDLRNCIAALANDEDLFARLFAHRFRGGDGLDGHSLGNLLIAALAEMTGDFAQSIRLASEVLAVNGRLLPATAANVTLAARMEDGSLVRGETQITASQGRIAEVLLEPPDAPALPEALEAIAAADLILVGPGSLYTSVITNLLVRGIPEALAASRAVRVCIMNLMTQPNESLHLTASEHIDRVYAHAGRPIFDYAMVNTGPIPAPVRERYAAQGAGPIVGDIDRIEGMGIRCVTGDFVEAGDLLRHAPHAVVNAALALAGKRQAAEWKHAPFCKDRLDDRAEGCNRAPFADPRQSSYSQAGVLAGQAKSIA